MDRLDRIKEYVNGIFDQIEAADEKRAAYIHSYGVSQCCAILAAKRGLDMELAIAIGLLHDVYAYKTGVISLHSQNGAEMDADFMKIIRYYPEDSVLTG